MGICSLCKSSNLVVYLILRNRLPIGEKSNLQQNSSNIKTGLLPWKLCLGETILVVVGDRRSALGARSVEDRQCSTGSSVAMALFRLPNECCNSAGKHATTSKDETVMA